MRALPVSPVSTFVAAGILGLLPSCNGRPLAAADAGGADAGLGGQGGSAGGGSDAQSGSGGAGGDDGGTNACWMLTMPSPQAKACLDCLTTSCSAELQQYLGPSWKQGDFSASVCKDFLECSCACDPNDSGCLNACISKITPECMSVVVPLGDCEQARCVASCEGGGSSGGG